MLCVVGVPRFEGFGVVTLGDSGSTITLKFVAGAPGVVGVGVETLGELLVPAAGTVPTLGADVPVDRDTDAPGAQFPLAQFPLAQPAPPRM